MPVTETVTPFADYITKDAVSKEQVTRTKKKECCSLAFITINSLAIFTDYTEIFHRFTDFFRAAIYFNLQS